MRLLELARTAWDAEALRLRRLARAQGMRAAYAAVAAVFGLIALLMLHLALFAALAPGWGPVWAALAVAMLDLVVLAILALLARRAGDDPIAKEALMVRKEAMRQLGDSAARAAVLAPLLKSQTAKKGLLGAAVTAAVVGLMSRR